MRRHLEALRARFRAARHPRAFAMFFATSLAARGVGIVCQVLQVPLVIATLGSESFGLWMAMTSVTNLLLFADLGLGIGAQNRIAEHLARSELAAARDLLGGVFFVMAALGTLLGAAFTVAALRMDFAQLFHLHDPAAISEAPGAALVMAWIFCAGFPFGLGQRLAFARQEGWRHNVTQAASSVLSLAAVAAAAALHCGLTVLVAVAQGAMLVGNATLLFRQLQDLGWIHGWRLRLQVGPLRDLFKVGAFFSVQQVLSTVLFSLPQVIISSSLGAAAVTPFNLVQRLFNLFAVLQNAFMLPLWPAYSQAKARREFGWMRRALLRSLWATGLCSVLPLLVGAAFAPTLIHLWVGPEAPSPPLSLVWLLCAWNALVFLQQPFSFLLAGVSEVRRTTLYSVLSACCSGLLMCLLARPLGASGVVLGLLVGYLPFTFIGSVVETRRYLNGVPLTAEPAPALSP